MATSATTDPSTTPDPQSAADTVSGPTYDPPSSVTPDPSTDEEGEQHQPQDNTPQPLPATSAEVVAIAQHLLTLNDDDARAYLSRLSVDDLSRLLRLQNTLRL